MAVTPPTIMQLLADCALLYPQSNLTKKNLAAYEEHLRDLPVVEVAAALRDLGDSGAWFPTVAAIRNTVVESIMRLPDESEALAQVERRVSWRRDQTQTLPEIHALVKQALDLVGGASAFAMTEEPGVIRGQFLRFYRELRATAISIAQRSSNAGALEGGRRALPAA